MILEIKIKNNDYEMKESNVYDLQTTGGKACKDE